MRFAGHVVQRNWFACPPSEPNKKLRKPNEINSAGTRGTHSSLVYVSVRHTLHPIFLRNVCRCCHLWGQCPFQFVGVCKSHFSSQHVQKPHCFLKLWTNNSAFHVDSSSRPICPANMFRLISGNRIYFGTSLHHSIRHQPKSIADIHLTFSQSRLIQNSSRRHKSAQVTLWYFFEENLIRKTRKVYSWMNCLARESACLRWKCFSDLFEGMGCKVN